MKDFWKNLKFAWFYAKDTKKELIYYIICNIIQVIISLILPILSAEIVVKLTGNDLLQIILIAIAIFLVESLNAFVMYATRRNAQKIYRETFSNIQIDLGKNVLKLQNSVLDENGSGVFIQRLTNDTGRIADVFSIIHSYLASIVTNIGIFAAIFIINKYVFIYLVLMTIILYFVEKNKTDKVTEKDKIYRKKGEKVSGFVGEIVRGARDIKMLNAEESFLKELKTRIYDLNNSQYNMMDVKSKFNLLSYIMTNVSDILLIVLLVYFISINEITPSTALVIYYYSGRIAGLVYYIGMFLETAKDFNLSASRIFDIINSDEFKKEHFGGEHLKKVKGDFEFKDVSFAYDNEPVLKDLSFKIEANSTVAFVGKSGAGKTTIFNLLCKMYDVNSGRITIDGIDIKKLDKESIRGNITIISQNPYIFNLSIRDNLKLVKEDLTEKEMIKACQVACLEDFILSLPDKYDTIIGEGGVNLSGGQKQRLAIARALIQKTEIILFDEATSALDNETQSSIQKAIDNMKNEYTILIIAHRLSTIINSDRILFLEDGKIEMEGTHKELLKKSKKYKELYESEISKVDENV